MAFPFDVCVKLCYLLNVKKKQKKKQMCNVSFSIKSQIVFLKIIIIGIVANETCLCANESRNNLHLFNVDLQPE